MLIEIDILKTIMEAVSKRINAIYLVFRTIFKLLFFNLKLKMHRTELNWVIDLDYFALLMRYKSVGEINV